MNLFHYPFNQWFQTLINKVYAWTPEMQTEILTEIWPNTLATGVPCLNRALSWGTARWINLVLAPEEQFWRLFYVRPKKIILIKRGGGGNSMKQKLLEIIQVTIWLNLILLSFTKWKWEPKPFLGRQNWVISTGGHLNLKGLWSGKFFFIKS